MDKVLEFFTDLQDNNYAYHVGDTFPREGLDVSEERLNELASSDNKRGKPVIEVISEAAEAVTEEKPRKKRGRSKNADTNSDTRENIN